MSVLKTGIGASLSRVRIPAPPPFKLRRASARFFMGLYLILKKKTRCVTKRNLIKGYALCTDRWRSPVERAALEMRYTRERIGGSNPSLSAITLIVIMPAIITANAPFKLQRGMFDIILVMQQ